MKKIALTTYAKIITALLSIVGYLTGCQIINDPKDEYGVPSADYVIKGKVTDAITNQPLKACISSANPIGMHLERTIPFALPPTELTR